MFRILVSALASLLTAAGGFAYADSARATVNEIAESLRNRIEAGLASEEIAAYGECVYCALAVPDFYEKRAFRLAWVDEKGPLPQAGRLVKCIARADLEGLRPADYHLNAITALLSLVEDDRTPEGPELTESFVDLELLLSDAFLAYGSHLFSGRVDPQTIDPEWHAQRRERDLTEVLEKALESGQIFEALLGLVPPQAGYAKLKEALELYRGIAARGAWAEVRGEEKLENGYRGSAVPALRARLVASGDLKSETGVPWEEAAMIEGTAPADSMWGLDLFDERVERAVLKFQGRHGLDPDGVVGPKTREALNRTLDRRIEQLEINMERYRWLPQDLGRRHIIVNIPSFELHVYEDDERVVSMRVVVGRQLRRTPVFSDVMTYLVFNPFWNVPESIAVEDILPNAREDSTYLDDKGIRVFAGWGADAAEIPRDLIDWTSLNDGDFRYRFVQDPGVKNSLGQIKFMFPNEFNVYLHDTPARELFLKPERTFSSGCIRVERPIELAEYVLKGDAEWTREKILAILETSEQRTVRIPEPIPIHILYWTAFVDQEGSVHFRKDVYDRDQRVLDALRKLPPSPGGTRKDIGLN